MTSVPKLPGPSPLVTLAILLAGIGIFHPCPAVTQGVLESWDVAGPYPANQVARDAYPNFNALFLAPWAEAHPDSDGIVNLNGFVERTSGAEDLVLARKTFLVMEDGVLQLDLEYTRDVDVFFNGWRVFSGRRPHSFGGPGVSAPEVSPDLVPLYARSGMNEIFLMVASESEDLAFRARLRGEAAAVPKDYGAVEELWMTPDTFLTPESVIKDPNRDLLYVTSFDNRFRAQKRSRVGTSPPYPWTASFLTINGPRVSGRQPGWISGTTPST